MYMSYILDFLSKQHVDRYGNQFGRSNANVNIPI